MTTTQSWLTEAKLHIGLKEIPGPKHNNILQGWLKSLGAWWVDDETPWCGVFVAHCMRRAGYKLPKHWYRAKGWLDWGVVLSTPCIGCIVVLEREGGGHVFIAIGKDKQGRIVGIGGNQSNKVSEAAFDTARVVGYRWPAEVMPYAAELPLVAHNGAASTQEA